MQDTGLCSANPRAPQDWWHLDIPVVGKPSSKVGKQTQTLTGDRMPCVTLLYLLGDRVMHPPRKILPMKWLIAKSCKKSGRFGSVETTPVKALGSGVFILRQKFHIRGCHNGTGGRQDQLCFLTGTSLDCKRGHVNIGQLAAHTCPHACIPCTKYFHRNGVETSEHLHGADACGGKESACDWEGQ